MAIVYMTHAIEVESPGQADMLASAVRVYRAWEAENMLDGDEPSAAGPSAVRELVRALLDLAKGDAMVPKKDADR